VAVNQVNLIRQLGMIEGSKNKYPYKEARLSDAGGDLSKQWVVVYYVFDELADTLVRKRIRVEGETVALRKRKATEYIQAVNKLLRDGFHINSAKAPAEELPLPEILPKAVPADKPLTFLEAADFYKKIKNKELRVDTTMDLYDLYLRQFGQFLEEKGNRKILLKNITPKIAHDFFDSAAVGARYYNNMLGFFKSFATFFINREDIDKNPFRSLKNLRIDESDDHRPFSAEQTREIRDAILAKGDEQLWLFCQFIYFLFMRPGKELRLLQVRDILDKQVKVTSETAKNRKLGFVDISVALELVIEQYKLRSYRPTYYVFSIDGHPGPEPVGVNYFYKRHVKIMKQLGLFGHDYDLYSWKPTGAVALYRQTKDILRVQKHCRHSSPDQTYTYLRKYGLVFEGVDMTDVPAIWD
jgi:integrase